MPENKNFFIILVVVLVLLSAGLGFYFGKHKGNLMMGTSMSTSNSMFTQQNAIIQGQVTKIDGRRLTVKSNNGAVDTFEAAEKIYITKFSAAPTNTGTNQPAPSPNTDLKTIELNKDASINLVLQNGKYVIVSVAITANAADVPSPSAIPIKPPVASASSQAAPSAKP